MIFVSAANSGNAASVLDRREPLALLAAHDLMQRYRVNPQRVYVGGFSGGSRVALRLALAYPDVFHGALRMAGSDPISNAGIPLPAAALFRPFQRASHLVYLTGAQDPSHLAVDTRSRQSMRHWCVARVDTVPMPWVGHAPAEPAPLARALQWLDAPAPPAPPELAGCRARIGQTLATQLQQVQDRLANGAAGDAHALLERIDARYGGLAAPRSVELARRIERLPPGATQP